MNLNESKEKLFKKHSGFIDILEYKNMSSTARFICKKGHEWVARASSVIIDGNGCSVCSQRKKYTIEDVKIFIDNQDCVLIQDFLYNEYSNVKSFLNIKMSCGHIRKMTFTNFIRGRRCRLCSWKSGGKNKKIKSLENLLNVLSENKLDFICIIGEYKGQNESKVRYSCENGHICEKIISNIFQNPKCTSCSWIELSKRFFGSKGYNWKGGITKLRPFIKRIIKEWKKESAKAGNYKCFITGDTFDDIHHLYSLSNIIRDSILELNLDTNVFMGQYTDEEMLLISEKVREIHYRHSLGICLRRDVHNLFHKIYGMEGFSENDFYDFVKKIKEGKIVIE